MKIKKTEFPLKTSLKKKTAGADLDMFIDSFSPDAVDSDLYVINKLVKKRERGGVTQYKVRWQGYNSKDDTWEPEENIRDWGGLESILEYEQRVGDDTVMAVLLANLDDDELATAQAEGGYHRLIKRHMLKSCMAAYSRHCRKCLGRRKRKC